MKLNNNYHKRRWCVQFDNLLLKLDSYGGQVYNSSSLSLLSLSLSEVIVSYSSTSLPAKQSPSGLYHLATCFFQKMVRIVVGAILAVEVMVVVVVSHGFAAGKEKRLHIGNDSQDMPQGDDYQDLLKRNLNKADIINNWANLWSERYHASIWITHWL